MQPELCFVTLTFHNTSTENEGCICLSRWNFSKFLVGKDGEVLNRYAALLGSLLRTALYAQYIYLQYEHSKYISITFGTAPDEAYRIVMEVLYYC